jgi:hypothetical protein
MTTRTTRPPEARLGRQFVAHLRRAGDPRRRPGQPGNEKRDDDGPLGSPLAGLRELDANLRAVLLRNLLEIVAARSARTRQDLATLVD